MPTYIVSGLFEKSRLHKAKLMASEHGKYIANGKTSRHIGSIKVNSYFPQNWWFGAMVESGNGKGALLYYVKKPGTYYIVRCEQLKGIRRGKGYKSRFTQTWKIKITSSDLHRRREIVDAKEGLNAFAHRIQKFFEKDQKVSVLKDLKAIMPEV